MPYGGSVMIQSSQAPSFHGGRLIQRMCEQKLIIVKLTIVYLESPATTPRYLKI